MKRSIDLRYIVDDKQREVVYAKGKLKLMRKAMELAVLCNTTCAIVMFDGAGKLTQFSTSDMDAILEQYGQAVLEPHERYTPHDLLYGSMLYANGFGVGPVAAPATVARSAQGPAGAGPSSSPGESPSGVSEAIGTQHLLGPLGLSIDAATFPPVSPRSEQAYSAIAGEFEKMLATMQQQQMEQQQHLQQLHRQQQRQQRRQQHKEEQAEEQLEQREQLPEGEGDIVGQHEAVAGPPPRPASAATPSSGSMPPPAARKPLAPAPTGAELAAVALSGVAGAVPLAEAGVHAAAAPVPDDLLLGVSAMATDIAVEQSGGEERAPVKAGLQDEGTAAASEGVPAASEAKEAAPAHAVAEVAAVVEGSVERASRRGQKRSRKRTSEAGNTGDV